MKKAIPRKILLSLAVVMLATLVAAPMVLASPATATRDFPTTVAPSAVFQVDLVVSDYGAAAWVTETIPAGFTYVAVSHPADINVDWDPVTGELQLFFMNDPVTGLFNDPAVFYYTVQAPATEGSGTFTGEVRDWFNVVTTVGGDDDVTVSAAATHTLTMAVSPAGGGTTNPAAGPHTYADSTVVTLTATAAAGYQFSNWSGAASGTSSTTTVTMDADKTATANFVVSTTPQTFAWWLYETYIEPFM